MKRGYKQTEVGVIPEEWEVRPVRQMGAVVTGKALAAYGQGSQRPYLRTKNVFDGEIRTDDVLTMPMTDEQFAHFCIKSGDVLLNEGQSLELVGRCAIYQDEYPDDCAMQNALLRFRARNGVSALFASYLFRHCQQTGGFARVALQTTSIAHLGGSRFEKLNFAWPKEEAEQQAIAEALSDVDGLLGALDRLIAKKRDLKQAAMQQLLTGQTRLLEKAGSAEPQLGQNQEAEPGLGVPCGWEAKQLGDVLTICHGRSQHEVQVENGSFPILATGGQIGTASRYLYDKPSVLIGRKGTINRPQYMDTPFWTVDTLFYSAIKEDNSAKFLYYRFCLIDWMQYNEASGVPSLNARTIESIEINCPEPVEQRAIATILSDMDAELAGLEQRREKTRALKQGMMQELLTGKTRLVQPAELGAGIAKEPKKKGHNWAINEAVVISVLTKHFGSEKFPLGRKRYTKFSYLLHRYKEHEAEGYLKKAAGPYNPATKYRGPESIAQKNGYIARHKNGKFSGFIAADHIAKAEAYFDEWYGEDSLTWILKFRHKKNDELELLATVDMAMEELRKAGAPVSQSRVKELIDTEPEWKPKLSRDTFSDFNIARVMRDVERLFDG